MSGNHALDPAPVRTERRGAALWVIIDRPQRRNALNTAVVEGIENALITADRDDAIRAVVITGAGDRAFCAGADLTGGTSTFSFGPDEPTTDFGRLARTARGLGKPLIARVNGACVAAPAGCVSTSTFPFRLKSRSRNGLCTPLSAGQSDRTVPAPAPR